MNASIANLINAIVLIACGVWGYVDHQAPDPSWTALIPVAIGVALLAMAPGVAKHNKAIAHVAVLLTLGLLIALLAWPLASVVGRGNTLGIVRVLAMIGSSILAMVMFVKSFIDARKARQAANEANG